MINTRQAVEEPQAVKEEKVLKKFRWFQETRRTLERVRAVPKGKGA